MLFSSRSLARVTAVVSIRDQKVQTGPKRGIFLARRGFSVYSLNKPNQPLHPPGSEVPGYFSDRPRLKERERDRRRERLVLPPGGLKNLRKGTSTFVFLYGFFYPLKNIWVEKQKNVPSAERFLAQLKSWITVMTFSEKAPWQENMPPLDAAVERLVSGLSIQKPFDSVRVQTVRTMDRVGPRIE